MPAAEQRGAAVGGLGAQLPRDLRGAPGQGVGHDQRVDGWQGGQCLGVKRADAAEADQA